MTTAFLKDILTAFYIAFMWVTGLALIHGVVSKRNDEFDEYTYS